MLIRNPLVLTSLMRTVIALLCCSAFLTTAWAQEPANRHLEYPTYFAPANGLSIAYQDFGDPNDEAVVLIMGLGAQLIHWQDEFVFKLVDAGYRVIRFDNRDIGLSEKLYTESTPGLITGIRYKLGMSLGAPYHLDDMAADTIGLLDHLNIEQAHVAGISMGGMIAQILAAQYPTRILSLTSIMSSSGAEHLPQGSYQMEKRDRDRLSREQALQEIVKVTKAIYAKPSSLSDAEWLADAARAYDRSHYDDGFARQFWAILDSGDRVAMLRSVEQPSLVIHGQLDPLVPLEHGQHTADSIPGSTLVVLDDMGHFMGLEHHDRIVAAMLPILQRGATQR